MCAHRCVYGRVLVSAIVATVPVPEGAAVGDRDGDVLGLTVGPDVGTLEGPTVGLTVGTSTQMIRVLLRWSMLL